MKDVDKHRATQNTIKQYAATMTDWKSHVLRCYDSPDHCLVCKFIDGDRSEAVMMETIRILDDALADERKHNNQLTECIRRMSCERALLLMKKGGDDE